MGAAAGDGLHAGGARVEDPFGRLQSFFAENPVAMGALGVAIGAALPSTETENRLMGESADDLKSAAKRAAEEQIERGKQAASAGLEEARTTMAPDAAASRSEPAATSPLGGPSRA